MRSYVFTAFAVFVLAFGAASAAPTKDAHTKQIQAAKKAVADALKDPASAQFREVTFKESTRAVCGEVNGKNSYGGYVGFTPFAYEESGIVHLVPTSISSADFDSLVRGQKELSAVQKFCE